MIFKWIQKTIVGLNTKYYRYQQNISQEQFAALTNFKMAYISTIENGKANLTLKNIDLIAVKLNIKPKDLFNEQTAKKALNLPKRIDTYKNKTFN